MYAQFASGVQDTLLLALASTGLAHVLVEHRPRLLSDNDLCYLSKELQSFLQHRHIQHTRSAAYHPMTQGKIERYHRSMKNTVNLQNYFLPGQLETEIASFVNYYNTNATTRLWTILRQQMSILAAPRRSLLGETTSSNKRCNKVVCIICKRLLYNLYLLGNHTLANSPWVK